MKNILFTTAALAALLFGGCTKDVETPEPDAEGGKGIMTLSADMAQFESTRTGLGEEDAGTMPILWREGDAIAATGAEGTAIYTLSKGAGTTNATFTYTSGTAPESITSAVYPASAAATQSVPNAQSYMAGSFDPAAAVMTWDDTTTPTNGQIAFKHVGSVVCLQLTGAGETVKEVRIALTPKGGDEAKTYTLTSTEGVTLSATATPFYIVVPGDATVDATYTTKFTILTADHGRMIKEPKSAKTFAPATLVRFAALAYTKDEINSMQFTIDLAGQANKSYTLPFVALGSVPHTLTIDWGDGATNDIAAGDKLSTAITHTYAEEKAYQITIISSQTDPTQAQMPDFKPGYYRPENNNAAKLKSMDGPMLNIGDENFASRFRGCTNLTSISAGLFDNNPQITDFASCFYECSSLTSIPAGLFDNNTLVTTFGHCFSNCSGLSGSIPAGLFVNNPQVTNFSYCFMRCSGLSGSIPAGLFDYNPQVTTFDNCFYECSSLSGSIPEKFFDNNPLVTTFNGCFLRCSGLSGSIPAGLFDNNPKVTDFSYCFSGCSGLTSIPTGLFDNNPEVTNFIRCFYTCSGLSGSIPTGLFDKNTKVTDFSYCFKECSSLSGSIPAGLFANNPLVTTFSSCFYNCIVLSGPIPAGLFANNPLVTTFDSCFFECKNLTSIPAGLFANNPLVSSFQSCFYNCKGLGSIPTGLFDNNTEVTTFETCFRGCSGITSLPAGLFDKNTLVTTFNSCFYYGNLTSLPAGLFAKNTKVTDFNSCFYYCDKLVLHANIFCDEKTDKSTRFKDQSVDFNSCFKNCGVHGSIGSGKGGTAPALWEYDFGTGTPVTTKCFSDVSKVTNAFNIPEKWKL